VIGDATQELPIAEGREGLARFKIKARDHLGATILNFVASSGSSNVKRHIDMSIRPATPHMTTLIAGTFRNGDQEVKIDRNLYPNYRKLNAGVSLLPLALAHGFVSYLSDYPYQCTEQIVSQAMPAMVLGARPEFGYVKTLNGADLSTLISELRARQNENGAYKLWPGGAFIDELASLYAQHFLLEAKERGGAVPTDLINAGNNYLQSIATRDGNTLTEERHSAYAIYLLTRQGQRTSAELSALQKRLDQRYAKEWPQDLTAAWMAASLSLMKQDRDADRLIKTIKFNANSDELYNDAMTRDAWLLYINARYFPSRLPQLPAEVLSQFAVHINQGSYHTLSLAATLMALDAYVSATGNQAALLSIRELLKDKTERTLKLPAGIFPTVAFTDQAAALRFGSDSQLNAFYMVEQSGFERTPPTTAIKQGLEIIREYTDATGKTVTSAELGQEVTVHVKFRGLDKRRLSTVAVVDLLPGGFELVIPPAPSVTTYNQGSVRADSESPDAQASTEGESEGEAEPSTEGEGDGTEYNNVPYNPCQFCVNNVSAFMQYADMREDRAVFYVSSTADVQEVQYRIKATSVGTFVLPPAYGEAMYDRSVIARSVAGSMNVTRPK